MTDLTLEVARELFEYDPETGALHWKTAASKFSPVKAGDSAGSLHASGYVCVMVRRRKHRVHRIAYLLSHGVVPKYIDHINGDKGDNRIANLRHATKSENAMNSRLSGRNSSGVKGVSWNYPTSKWRSQIVARGVKHTKTFSLLEEAQEWVEFIREELHGCFANHGNFGGV